MSEHFYKNMSDDERTELMSNFLVDSWSYSKLSSFATNEKGFEMRYIYGIRGKSSSTTIAGSAYHLALDAYFTAKRKGHQMDLVDMEEVAFDYINDVKPNFWKLQKTTPSVEDCAIKAIKTVSALLKNFYREKGVYEDHIKEILAVELKYSEYLTINGVDVPLPCNAVIDLVILTNENKIVVIDHKSKNAFSDEKEISLSIGKQAITYTKCYEANTGKVVNEVWFVENKYSENRDKSPQLSCFKFVLDKGVRALYECLLYEPLKRMLEATSDPNYVYLINDSDNFTDKAELHEFWAKTMLAEVEDFQLMEDKKEAIGKRLKKIRDASAPMVSASVIKKFRQNAAEFIQYDLSNKDMTTQEKIEHVLRTFGIIVKVAHVFDGYSSNTYLLDVSAGVKISSIHSHRMDISNALDVSSIRLSKELFVYRGKSYLSIESSKKRDKDLIFDPSKLVGMKIPIGIDNFNQTVVWDLDNHSTPHSLVCGATGCLAANTEISVYIPHYKRQSKTKTIETLFKIQNDTPNHQTNIKNRNKKDILVRCLDETTNTFTYTPFDVVYSGNKQCFRVTTSSGNTIETTGDHRFLTPLGWRKLSELNINDVILYRHAVRDFTGRKKQLPLKDVFVKYHPKGRVKTIVDLKSKKPYKYFRVPIHHFIYEANKNNLSIEEYKKILNNYDGSNLFFIPKGYQIDHIDGDRENNDPSNLQMLSINDHAIKTVKTADGVFGHFRPKECTILNIERTEIKETYDICCKSDNHNFVANGLVVHNSGKSVSILSTIEYAKLAGINEIYIFDPKFEFTRLRDKSIFVYNEIEDIEASMELLVKEMNERVKLSTNRKTLVIFDEFADAVASSRKGNELNVYEMVQVGMLKSGAPKMERELKETKKSLEENLRVLLQKGRSSGFRVLAATQRASVKVITGDAKVNFPVQICFRVPKEIDSKVVIDEGGAESLAGMGDGLIKSPEYKDVIRFQAFYKPN
jgi:S-DNA-T family DNA segregation ATPase FtsK/SpoIIIE